MRTIRELQRAAQRAQALGDPTRLSIALAIQRRPGDEVIRIADEVGRDQSLVTRHCQKLHQAGIIDRSPLAMPYYRLTPYGERLLRLVMEEPETH